MNETILVVDDEPKILQLARDYLVDNGFKVLTSGDGVQALAIARKEKPDLIVLDLMLPGMDGLDVCRAIRKESDVPIIMLTARAEEADQLIGLELGADDYITKPFSPRTLVARVRALLRRAKGDLLQEETLRSGSLELNLKRMEKGHQIAPLDPSGELERRHGRRDAGEGRKERRVRPIGNNSQVGAGKTRR